jgi:serine O-acetyltransferase
VRPALLRKLCSLIYKVLFKFVQIITGVELPCEVVIGLQLRHRPFWRHHRQRLCPLATTRIRNGVVVGLKNVDEPIADIRQQRRQAPVPRCWATFALATT